MSAPLHRALADLARDHGRALFTDATAFRGALDDYLDETQASGGTINLLTDAVRLGALDGLLGMLDSGAQPGDAVESAGQRLARDRGSSDVRGCQWAIAVLGFALGRVPESLATGLDPDAATTSPPGFGAVASTPPAPPAPPAPPISSPPAAWPPAPQQPITSPPHQPAAPAYAAGWAPSQPAPSRSNTAFIVSAIAVAVVVIVVGVIAIVALAGGDDDPSADPTNGTDSSQTSDASASDDSGAVPDIGGPTVTGTGYTVQAPEGWTDGTDEFAADNPDLGTLDRIVLWGETFSTARGNLIIETQSSFGSEDPEELAETWRSALVEGDDSADITDGDDRMIGGQRAITVEIARTNDGGVPIQQRSHLVINGDTAYSLTITGRDGDDDVVTAFDEILTTWQWED